MVTCGAAFPASFSEDMGGSTHGVRLVTSASFGGAEREWWVGPSEMLHDGRWVERLRSRRVRARSIAVAVECADLRVCVASREQ